jgi:hypothetical protein
MKEYRFDYMREWVEPWHPSVPRTLEQIRGLPFDILLPWITPDEYRPAKDHYGEDIDNFEEWYRQREEYCLKLAKEYETLQNKRKQHH